MSSLQLKKLQLQIKYKFWLWLQVAEAQNIASLLGLIKEMEACWNSNQIKSDRILSVWRTVSLWKWMGEE